MTAQVGDDAGERGRPYLDLSIVGARSEDDVAASADGQFVANPLLRSCRARRIASGVRDLSARAIEDAKLVEVEGRDVLARPVDPRELDAGRVTRDRTQCWPRHLEQTKFFA